MDFQVEAKHKAEVLFEVSIGVKGRAYLVIYGKHINGYFCCVPNWGWGCEMAEPEDVWYNADKLEGAGAKPEVAQALAEAIKTLQMAARLDRGEV